MAVESSFFADEHQLAAARFVRRQGRSQKMWKRLFTPWKIARRSWPFNDTNPLERYTFSFVAEPLHEFFETSAMSNGCSNANEWLTMSWWCSPCLHLVEKIRVHLQLPVHVEGVDVEQLVQRHLALLGAQDARVRVHRADLLADAAELRLVHEIGLVQQDEVGHRDLVGRDLGLVQLLENLFGVHHRDDGVELHETLQRRDVHERLRDRARIGDARSSR